MKRVQLFSAALALTALSAIPAAAQSFAAGTDALTTPGGGQTQVNLDSYPVASVLGSAITSSHTPSLKGVPVDPAAGGSPDTYIDRGAISSGFGTLQIKALNLVSENSIALADGRHYNMQVCLSDTPSSLGSITLSQANSDGGTFNSSFSVLPKIVLTNTANSSDVVTIDCGVVNCGSFTMASSNSGWVKTGGSGNFNPASKGIPSLPTGLRTVKNCNGTHQITVNPPAGFYPGWTACSTCGPSFPPAPPGERHEDLTWHKPFPPTDCAASTTTTAAARAAATSDSSDRQDLISRSYCLAVAEPGTPVSDPSPSQPISPIQHDN